MTGKHEEKRSDKTRAALIEAGISLFGEHGFSATTTRMLAEAADANVAAIPYHFGSKEGLYHAVVEHIADGANGMMSSARAQLEAGMAQRPSPDQAITLIEDLFCHMAQFMIGTAAPRRWSQLIMREQSRPTRAFDILYEKMMRPMQHIVLRTLEAATGIDAQSDEAKLRTHMMFGQVLVFLTSRETILRSLQVQELSDAHIAHIGTLLRNQMRAIVRGAMRAQA